MNQTYKTKLEKPLEKQVTKIKLAWLDGEGDNPIWSEVCAWCVEQYGLPGAKFMWHPMSEHMEFDFYDEKDAIHFMLRWS